MKKRMAAVLLLTALVLSLAACAAKPQKSPYEQAKALIDSPVDKLYSAIGYPVDTMYASSCLGEGEDGELYYDGFTVYTYRENEDNETIYDVMENFD